jgi:hypothetical protein
MIIEIIKAVESSNNQFAFRFEEALYFQHRLMKSNLGKILKRVRMLNQCSNDTALMIVSTSWGFFQLLGIDIYGMCGYDKNIMDFLHNKDDQEAIFNKFCVIQRIDLANVENELKNITSYYIEKEKQFKSNLDLIKDLENELICNKNKYKNLIDFINHYNGAKFLSDAFMDYLLRMITEAKKYK